MRNVIKSNSSSYSLADVEADLSSVISEIENTYLSTKDIFLQMFPPEIKPVQKETKPVHKAGRGL